MIVLLNLVLRRVLIVAVLLITPEVRLSSYRLEWPVFCEVPVNIPALLTDIIFICITLRVWYNFNIEVNNVPNFRLRVVWNCVTAVRLGLLDL